MSISDLISVRDFIDETIAQHNQGPINGRRTNHFEIIIECENHMPVAIRQFDSEEEAMEYLNMRLPQIRTAIHLIRHDQRHRNPRTTAQAV